MSVFLTWARLRPADHWPNTYKYDSKNKKHNNNNSERPWKLWCRKTSRYKSFGAKTLDSEPSRVDNWTISLGRREYMNWRGMFLTHNTQHKWIKRLKVRRLWNAKRWRTPQIKLHNKRLDWKRCKYTFCFVAKAATESYTTHNLDENDLNFK